MPISRHQKEEQVEVLERLAHASSAVFVCQNKGLTVADMRDLRAQLRPVSLLCKVAKNTLAKRALEDTSFANLSPLLEGPSLLTFTEDPVSVAKTVVEYAKGNEKFVYVGASLDGQLLAANDVQILASLPPLPVARAQLAGLIATPAVRLVSLLQAPAAQLARVFNAYAQAEGGE